MACIIIALGLLIASISGLICTLISITSPLRTRWTSDGTAIKCFNIAHIDCFVWLLLLLFPVISFFLP